MISNSSSLVDPRPIIRYVLSNRFAFTFTGIAVFLLVVSQILSSLEPGEVADGIGLLVSWLAFLVPAAFFVVIVVCWNAARKLRLKQYKCNVCRYQWQQVQDHPELVESRIEWAEAELKSTRRGSNRKRLIGFLFNTAYLVSVGRDNWARGQALCEEALPMAEQDGDQKNLAIVLHNLGFVLIFRGEWMRAIPILEQSVAIFRQIGEWRSLAGTLGDLGLARLFLGQYEAASRNLEECLRYLEKMGDTGWEVIRYIEGMAGVAVGLAQPARAATLAGAAKTWYERSGIVQSLTLYRYFQQTVNRIQTDLDILNFDAAWQEGAKMTPQEVYQYAVSNLEPVG